MKQFRRLLLAIIGLALLASCSSKQQADAGKPADPQNRDTATSQGQAVAVAPAFTLDDASGKQVSLADYKGKVIILNFWATWCPPCRDEIPGFIELQKQYGPQGLQVVGLSVDKDGWKAVKPFMEKSGINYPILMSSEDVFNTYQRLLPAEEQGAIPFTFIITKDGTIRQKIVGGAKKADFENMIKPLLGS